MKKSHFIASVLLLYSAFECDHKNPEFILFAFFCWTTPAIYSLFLRLDRCCIYHGLFSDGCDLLRLNRVDQASAPLFHALNLYVNVRARRYKDNIRLGSGMHRIYHGDLFYNLFYLRCRKMSRAP